MSFIIRKISSSDKGFGPMIKSLRKVQGIKIEQASKDTKIQLKYLEAFENGNLGLLPDSLYARNFLRRYVEYLGGEPEYFLERFEEERGTCDLLQTKQQLPKRKVKKTNLLVFHRFIKIGLLAVVILAVLGYFGWQIYSLIQPPEIFVYEPANNLSTDQATITVTGMTPGEATVFVNDLQVLTDTGGNFETTVNLQRGLNTIIIEAKRKYSKKQTVYRNVILNESMARD